MKRGEVRGCVIINVKEIGGVRKIDNRARRLGKWIYLSGSDRCSNSAC